MRGSQRPVADPGTMPRVTTADPRDTVRLALAAESAQLAAVQRRCWEADLPTELAGAALAVPVEDAERAWASAIDRPPLATFRVLAAIGERGAVCGFAAVGPSPDPDADPATDALIAEFAIDPGLRRRGHGSRLLNAVMDTLRADRFTRATWWVSSTADELRAFVTSSGWAPDGANRQVGVDERTHFKEIRLHTSLGVPSPPTSA